MSPVAQSSPRSTRSAVLAVSAVVVGLAALLGLFVWAIPSLTEQDQIEVRLGPQVFSAGNTESLAESIANDGPLLFADVAAGDRDVFLQHLGDDPDRGWHAFEARRSGASRDCSLRWEDEVFVDPCDGTEVPASGEGLEQFRVEITEDGEVILDLVGTEDLDDALGSDNGDDGD